MLKIFEEKMVGNLKCSNLIHFGIIITVCILIFLYIYDNVGYDKYWSKITWIKLENTLKLITGHKIQKP